MFTCPADWISPNYIMDPNYKTNPPAADGRKVILNDTDYVDDQLTVYHDWVWKCMLRGQHPVFMDPCDASEFCEQPVDTPESNKRLEHIRDNIGYSLAIAERMDLAAMVPMGDLPSTGYCLANPGSEYLVYLPEGGSADVDLSGESCTYSVEWFEPASGIATAAKEITGGEVSKFNAPFENDAVLYICKL